MWSRSDSRWEQRSHQLCRWTRNKKQRLLRSTGCDQSSHPGCSPRCIARTAPALEGHAQLVVLQRMSLDLQGVDILRTYAGRLSALCAPQRPCLCCVLHVCCALCCCRGAGGSASTAQTSRCSSRASWAPSCQVTWRPQSSPSRPWRPSCPRRRRRPGACPTWATAIDVVAKHPCVEAAMQSMQRCMRVLMERAAGGSGCCKSCMGAYQYGRGAQH